MPTYDYKCDACGHQFELFQSIKADPIKKCPSCGKLKVKRLIGTGAGLLFKGGGFYITDYRSDSYKSAAKSDGGAGGSSTPSTSGGESKPASTPAESKPAAKAESKPAASKKD
jgi:putative FmdB family regulatory protein